MLTKTQTVEMLLDIVQSNVCVEKRNGTSEPIDVKVNTRGKRYIYTRAMCYKMLRDLGWSLEQIGRHFGKNHATVRHALIGFEYMMKDDKELACLFPEIQAAFYDKVQEHVKTDSVLTLSKAKVRISELELELKKLRLVEADYLKSQGKTAVVYNKFLDKLVLL